MPEDLLPALSAYLFKKVIRCLKSELGVHAVLSHSTWQSVILATKQSSSTVFILLIEAPWKIFNKSRIIGKMALRKCVCPIRGSLLLISLINILKVV